MSKDQTVVTTEEYFGGCPKCGQTGGYRNVGRNHWGACDTHKTCWPIGENLFSSWHDETEEVWERNARELEVYEVVKPIFPPDPRTPEEIEADRLAKAARPKYSSEDDEAYMELIHGIERARL